MERTRGTIENGICTAYWSGLGYGRPTGKKTAMLTKPAKYSPPQHTKMIVVKIFCF